MGRLVPAGGQGNRRPPPPGPDGLAGADRTGGGAVGGAGAFGPSQPGLSLALVLAGISTSLPLVWFTAGARRLRLATIGFLQFLSPSIQFLLAVLYFGEPFAAADFLTFGCIWVAIALYIWPRPRAVPAA